MIRFNESSHMAICIYALIFVGLVLVPIIHWLDIQSNNTKYVLSCCGTSQNNPFFVFLFHELLKPCFPTLFKLLFSLNFRETLSTFGSLLFVLTPLQVCLSL